MYYTYQIEFHNSKFFIADNTLNSFISLVKGKERLERGKGNGYRIIYIDTLLSPEQIKQQAQNFEKKYNYLQIKIMNKTPNKTTLKESFGDNDRYNNMPRPARMEKPNVSAVASYGSCWPGFYIGDQLHNILVDKYGAERGEKVFDGLLDLKNNAIYTICGDIMKEKYKMLVDMGENPRSMDYFDCAYLPLWEVWVQNKGRKATKTGQVQETKPEDIKKVNTEDFHAETSSPAGENLEKIEGVLLHLISSSKPETLPQEHLRIYEVKLKQAHNLVSELVDYANGDLASLGLN